MSNTKKQTFTIDNLTDDEKELFTEEYVGNTPDGYSYDDDVDTPYPWCAPWNWDTRKFEAPSIEELARMYADAHHDELARIIADEKNKHKDLQQQLYSISEAARVLSMHPNIIRKGIRGGNIMAVSVTVGSTGKQAHEKKTAKNRKTYRIPRTEIERIIREGL